MVLLPPPPPSFGSLCAETPGTKGNKFGDVDNAGFSFNTNKINFPLSGFRMVGIMAMMDPPRATVPDSIAKCQVITSFYCFLLCPRNIH